MRKMSAFDELNKILENGESIHLDVDVNKRKFIVTMIKIALSNNLTQTAFLSVLDMICRIFRCKILPNSRYFMDKIFNSSKIHIKYHAICI